MLKDLRFIIIIVTFLTVSCQRDADEDTPYEFGFTIDGQQHRHEKKDVNGIIQGEFGFITADGIYHVTVYATDENGNFKILSMRNVRISAPLDGSPLPPGAKIESLSQNPGQTRQSEQPQPTTEKASQQVTTKSPTTFQFTTQSTIKPACGGCGYVTTAKPKVGQSNGFFQTPAFQGQNSPQPHNGGELSPEVPSRVSSNAGQPPLGQNQAQPQPLSGGEQSPEVPSRFGGYNNQNQAQNLPLNPVSQPGNVAQSPASSFGGYNNQNQAQNLPLNPVSQPENVPQSPATGFGGYNSQPPIDQNQAHNLPLNPVRQLGNVPQSPASYPPAGTQGQSQPNPNEFQKYPEPKPNPLQSSPENPINYPGQISQLPVAGTGNYPGQTQEPAINSGVDSSNYRNPAPEQPVPPQTDNRGPLSKVQVANGVIKVPGNPDIPIRDKYPGMTDGLPAGISEKNVTDLLYKFNYTVGFQGHYEKGYKNGAKVGGYFVTGRDGVQRIVTYVADENGYRPKVKFIRLDLGSDEVPKPGTEKSFGVKNFEFVWYPIS